MMHILWPDHVWEIQAERTLRKNPNSRPVTKTRRIAQFTSFEKANDYLNACTLKYSRPASKLATMISVCLGTDPDDIQEFDPDSPLADFQNAWIVRATVLPIDPEFVRK